jgi:hypothetical protein
MIYNFPPKSNVTFNKNVLVAFESSTRYRQLTQPNFFLRGPDSADAIVIQLFDKKKNPTWNGGERSAEQIDSSYSELPALFYRDPGLPFRDRCVYFVCTCVCVCVCVYKTGACLFRCTSAYVHQHTYTLTRCVHPCMHAFIYVLHKNNVSSLPLNINPYTYVHTYIHTCV